MGAGPTSGGVDVAVALQRVADARSRLRRGSAALRAGLRPERVTRHLVAHPLLTLAGAAAVGFLVARIARRSGPALRSAATAGPIVLGLARRWGPLAARAWLARKTRGPQTD